MRFALSPLPWIAGPDGRLDGTLAPERADLLRRIRLSGFTATPADLAPDGDPAAYLDELEAAGLAVAPGYVGFDLADPAALPSSIRLARTMASKHRALGLSEVFIADYHNDVRVAQPARGVEAAAARNAAIAHAVRAIAAEFVDQGVMPAFHQHVGTWVETGEELRSLLDAVEPDLLGAGVDVGHLLWAGIDPLAFVRENRDRVVALHIKDVHADRISADPSADYFETVRDGIVAEPGRGDVDLDAIVAEFADRPDLWAIVEVDQPDGVGPDESAARCAAWVAALPAGAGVPA